MAPSASRPRRQWAQLFTASDYQHSAHTRQSSSMGPTDNRHVLPIVRPQSHTPPLSWMDVALPSDKAITRGDMTTSSAFWSGIFSNSGNVCSVSRPTPPRMLRSSTFPNCRFDSANDDCYFPPTLCAVPAIGNFCLMLIADKSFFRLWLRRPHNVQTLSFTLFPCEKFSSSWLSRSKIG